ncbi:MAG TPA: VanW family protein [Acidimicrobiales bacterium]|nr:VanW family protein [Acidimicrobiales bacterium]
MRRPRLGILLGTGIPVAVVLVLLAAWAFDTSAAADGTYRNVELAGRDVGRLSEDELDEAVAEVAVDFASTPVRIATGGDPLSATASELGLEVDRPATVDAVLAEGREGSVALRPLAWSRSFVAPYEVAVRYQVRTDRLALALAEREGDGSRQPMEPTILASPEAVRIQAGAAGQALDPTEVGEALLEAADAGESPITVTVEPVQQAPQVSDDEAQALADEAAELTGQPFTTTVAGRTATFDVAEQRAWLGSRATPEGLELTLDQEAIDAALRDRIGSLGDAAPQNARFTVENGAVRLIPAVVGISCCSEDAPGQIAEAILGGEDTVEVEPVTDEPDLTTAGAEALGIREPVGTVTEWKGQPQVKSFTTYHACCEPRVTNIHKMADLVRGALVGPGDTFSVNGHVGQRTVEKGFVEAGAIANGVHVEEVGGGVSQFATTLFNAAFFAGLPFGEYQSHSEHFSRYPYGREATMGYEHPDLQFTNDTPYGILIWTSYTDTSLTITLYSTQYASGQQTGQTTGRDGRCTTVSTQRTITYADGRTAADTVRARYRDAGATSC